MTQKILIVDDEKDFTELAATLLEFHAVEVDAFNDPLLVEEALHKNAYKLIVTDIMMPGLDGFGLIEKIRAIESYKSTPIIVLTAKPLNDQERKHLLQHDVHFMMKPFEPLTLVELIRRLAGS